MASEIITGEDFYQTAYGILFDCIVEMFQQGKPVDLITLQDYLKEKDVPPEISNMEFARDLLMQAQTSANADTYAKIVREKSVMRRLIKVNEETANTCYQQNKPLDEILEDAQKKVFELAETGNSEEYVPIRQVVLNPWMSLNGHQRQRERLRESRQDSLTLIISFPVYRDQTLS